MVSTEKDDGHLVKAVVQFIYLFMIYLMKIRIIHNNNIK